MKLVMAIIMMFTSVPATQHVSQETCPQYRSLLETYNPGWDVDWMDHRMWIESKCNPEADNGSHTGLLQIADSWRRKLTEYLEVPVTKTNLKEAELNVVTASVLFQWQIQRGRDPYQPWGGR